MADRREAIKGFSALIPGYRLLTLAFVLWAVAAQESAHLLAIL